MELLTLPAPVHDLISQLNTKGFEAFAVGGCVRDALLGRPPHDWDLCTSAAPDEIFDVFPNERVLTTGLRHGTLTVLTSAGPVEVTSYRTDGIYSDHRHPDRVRFVRSLHQDLARRDFTINAIAWHPTLGLQDFFHGQSDLQNQLIRCVGDPVRRFHEDSLRILRALRFSARFGFAIEPQTAAAMHTQASLLRFVSAERILAELKAFLAGTHVLPLLLDFRDVFAVILPEMIPMFDHPQYNPHHCFDLWEHTCHAVAEVAGDPLLGLTMLFHDIGKPRCFTRDSQGIGHFHGHPEVSARMTREILDRLRCDHAARDTIVQLVLWHDRARSFSRKRVRRMLAELGPTQFRRLLRVAEADARAQNPALLDEKLRALREGEQLLETVLAETPCLSRKDLAVNGSDLLAEGWPRGPALGDALEQLLRAVVDEIVPNERAALLAYLRDKTPESQMSQNDESSPQKKMQNRQNN